jgi:CDP-2,3-bis-(O-geranylgeranyl)-sn-glycerol synthase
MSAWFLLWSVPLYSNLYQIFLYPIIYIFPAYVANAAPVIFGGGKPLDFGQKIAGKRIFGDHKTIRGTISSLLSGFITSIIIAQFIPYMLMIGILLTIGANVGDLLGSFIKRRMNYASGKSFPVLDQYGFLIFAVLFALPFGALPTTLGFVFLVILTGAAHILSNIIAHRVKLKNVPW